MATTMRLDEAKEIWRSRYDPNVGDDRSMILDMGAKIDRLNVQH